MFVSNHEDPCFLKIASKQGSLLPKNYLVIRKASIIRILLPTLFSILTYCNIPKFQFGMLYIRSSLYIIFICILVDPRNSTQLKDPRRELRISLFFIFEFSQILKIGSFHFTYFIFNYFYYKNMREGIKWLSQNKEILRI